MVGMHRHEMENLSPFFTERKYNILNQLTRLLSRES